MLLLAKSLLFALKSLSLLTKEKAQKILFLLIDLGIRSGTFGGEERDQEERDTLTFVRNFKGSGSHPDQC
jgi:hypothetical protein